MRRSHLFLTLVVALGFSPSHPATAQNTQYWGNSTPVRFGDGLPDRPGGFTYCRLAYTSVRNTPSGNGWRTDFPQADRNLSARLAELTPTPISSWSHGEPGFTIVQATDPELYQCPFLMATDVGQLGFSETEAHFLRDFLLKGGFLWADDFWGSAEWNYFSREVQRIFPEYPIVDVPMDHPLFNIVYQVPRVPQIPSISHWRRSGGGTSEQGMDSATPSMRAVLDDRGRILVLITHNTDISDGWEREAEDPDFFRFFSPDAYALGVNAAVWMMTH